MASDELVAWLRAEIEADRRDADVKIIREHWKIDPDQWIAGTGIVNEQGRPVAVGIGDYAARHIVRHDPLDVLADCDAKLAILDELEAAQARHSAERADFAAWIRGEAPGRRPDFEGPEPGLIAGLERAVRLLGRGYRFRDGYREAELYAAEHERLTGRKP
jgi:hypothetical protein